MLKFLVRNYQVKLTTERFGARTFTDQLATFIHVAQFADTSVTTKNQLVTDIYLDEGTKLLDSGYNLRIQLAASDEVSLLLKRSEGQFQNFSELVELGKRDRGKDWSSVLKTAKQNSKFKQKLAGFGVDAQKLKKVVEVEKVCYKIVLTFDAEKHRRGLLPGNASIFIEEYGFNDPGTDRRSEKFCEIGIESAGNEEAFSLDAKEREFLLTLAGNIQRIFDLESSENSKYVQAVVWLRCARADDAAYFPVSALGTDIVGFSKGSSDNQKRKILELMDLISKSLSLENIHDGYKVLHTGDGAILVFEGDITRAYLVARRIAQQVREHNSLVEKDEPIRLRMGLHNGYAFKIRDLNGQMNYAGDTLNITQRVMSAAGENQILISAGRNNYKDTLIQNQGSWKDTFCGEYEIKVKHGDRIIVSNVYKRDHYGVKDVPVLTEVGE